MGPCRNPGSDFTARKHGGVGDGAFNFTDKHYSNVLESMGQSIHLFKFDGTIIYWNRSAELLYGHSAAEALGGHALDLVVDVQDHDAGDAIISRVGMGETWTGRFPVKNKWGLRFLVITTISPFYDDNGTHVGILCVSCDAPPFEGVRTPIKASAKHSGKDSTVSNSRSISTSELSINLQKLLEVAKASRLSILVSKLCIKIKSKLRKEKHVMDMDGCRSRSFTVKSSSNAHSFDNMKDFNSSGAGTHRDHSLLSPFGVFSEVSHGKHPSLDCGYMTEGKPRIHKIITSKHEGRIYHSGIRLPKGSEHELEELKTLSFASPSSYSYHDNELRHGKRPSGSSGDSDYCSGIANSSGLGKKVDNDTHGTDHEISWEDLALGEQIGQGSSGTVYHAMWLGSEVAVKAFFKREYSDQVILSFRQEVSLMKRLKHPNLLLLMGAATSLQHLCIITEFLPRGNLFQLMRRNGTKFGWRRRTLMALDIARGMNYLHQYNPPIVHRDLKSSNLLVDKNWTVKVGDFGLSRLKHETFLNTKNGQGTPQWMAPEVLRHEPSDEKSDIYSFGVILWELATEKIPWDNLNPMQVIAVVGFLNQKLEIPEDVDPEWASMIESCWREPKSRPTCLELLAKLEIMQKKYSIHTDET